MGGVVALVGNASHAQLLVFAYGSKHVALVNAELLASGTPGTDDTKIVDFETDLTLTATSPHGFSGGSAYIAGGIPDPGRKGVWLATADGYYFFDLTTNKLTTLYKIDTGTFGTTTITEELAENIGGDVQHNLLLAGNYQGVQLVDLAAGKSYYMDPTYYNTNVRSKIFEIDGDAVDSGLQVGLFTPEDESLLVLINLATLKKTDAAAPGISTFVPSTTNGLAVVTLGSFSPTISGSAVDSSTHLVVLMAGFSEDVAVGRIQDPGSVASGGTWAGFTDWAYYTLTSSATLGSYSFAGDPHAVGVVGVLANSKSYGYLLDGFSAPTRVLQIDLDAFLKLTRMGTTGDPAHQPSGDPAAAGGPIKAINVP